MSDIEPEVILEKAQPKTPKIDISKLLPPGKRAIEEEKKVLSEQESQMTEDLVYWGKMLFFGGLGSIGCYYLFFYLKKIWKPDVIIHDIIPKEVLDSAL